MISAGEVGAIFTIKDEASVVLRVIAAQMNALQGNIDKLATSFKAIKLPPGIATAIGRIDKAMSSAMGTADKLETSLTDIGVAADRGAVGAVAGFGRIDAAISTTQGKVAALRKEMGSVGRGVGGGGGGAWARPGGGGGSSGHSGASGHGPLHTNLHAGPVGMRTGDGLLIGGAVAGFGIWEALKATADFQQVQMNLLGGGVSRAEIERASKSSKDIGNKYGLSARDVLQTMNEIRNPLNRGTTADDGMESAIQHMPALAEASVRLRANMGEHGGDIAKELYDFVKSAEFKNKIGEKDFDKSIKSMTDASVATGGIVGPDSWLKISQYARTSLPGMSDDYLYRIMPELAQEFRGAPAGTASGSLYQQFIAGAMRTTGLRLLDKLGMVDETRVDFDKNGRVVKARPGFYTDGNTLKENPLTGMANLLDAMKAHGITSESDQRDYISQIIGNRTAAQLGMTLGFQAPRLLRGAAGIDATANSGVGATDYMNENPYSQWNNFTAAATNASVALGTAIMPEATAALKNLTATATGFGGLLSGRGTADDINKALFGSGGSDAAPRWLKWIEGNWSSDQRLFGGKSGPHGVVGSGSTNPVGHPIDAIVGAYGASHTFAGRDPRSPQTGTLAYVPPSAPVSVSATLSGPATAKFGAVTIQVSGQSIAAAIVSDVKGMIEGLFKSLGAAGTNSDSSHDGRASPTYPDHMHGAH